MNFFMAASPQPVKGATLFHRSYTRDLGAMDHIRASGRASDDPVACTSFFCLETVETLHSQLKFFNQINYLWLIISLSYFPS
jgi:hypothetical protein